MRLVRDWQQVRLAVHDDKTCLSLFLNLGKEGYGTVLAETGPAPNGHG